MIDLGDLWPISLAVTDPNNGNAPVDAGTVALAVTLPDLTVSNYTLAGGTVTRDGVGLYHVDYPTVQAGRHLFRWVTTGTGAGAYSDVFYVAAADPGLLISLADARKGIGMPSTDKMTDEDLRDLIAACTPIIEDIVGPVLLRTETEYHDGGNNIIVVDHAPILSVTSVTESYGSGYERVLNPNNLFDGSALDPFGYTVDLDIGLLTRRYLGADGQFADGRGNIRVIYNAGRTIIKPNINRATRRLVRHLYQQETQGLRPAVGQPEPLALTPNGFAVPRVVLSLLSDSARSQGIA